MMGQGERVAGIVLAGGRGSRMGGGGKSLRRLGDRTLLEHVWERALTQVDLLLLSYNDDPRLLPITAQAVLVDSVPGHPGPLAGILSGLEFLRAHHPDCHWLASFACDSPWFPLDLVQRLLAAARQHEASVAVATCDARMQPVFALWAIDAAARMRETLHGDGPRGVGRFLRELSHVCVDWPAGDDDPFFNINTPDEFEQAIHRLHGEPDRSRPQYR